MELLKRIATNINLKKLIWPFIAFLLIILFNIIFTKGFIRLEIKDGRLFGSLVDILNRGAPVMLLSIGMTLVYATGGIDLSVGAIMAISGAVAAIIIRPGYTAGILEYGVPVPIFIVIIIPLLVSIIAGLWNGFLVSYIRIQPIVATLILMITGRGIAQLITSGQIIIFQHKSFQYIGSGELFGIPFPIVIVFLLLLLTYGITRKTQLGMLIEAVGENPAASRYMGLNTKLIKLIVYIFCGLCAGIAGLIVTSDIKGADGNNCGLYQEFDAIASVIIGGTVWGGKFTIAGSMIGTLIIQSLTTTILTRGIPPEQILVPKAFVVLVVSLIQSEEFKKIILNFKKFILVFLGNLIV